MNVTQKLEDIEREAIEFRLRYHGYNKSKTADSLGISLRGLQDKLVKYFGEKEEGQEAPPSVGPATGAQLESASKDAQKQSMPVRKREEIQKVSPSKSA